MQLGRSRQTEWHRWLGIESGRLRLVLIPLVAMFLLTLQSAVAAHPRLRLDVAALVVVYLALDFELLTGLAMAVIVGYLADVFGGESRGLYTLSLVLVFLALRLFVFRIIGSRWLIVTAIGLVSTLAAVAVRFFTEGLLGPNRSTFDGALPALPSALIGAVVLAYPVYALLRAINERLKPADEVMFGGGRRAPIDQSGLD